MTRSALLTLLVGLAVAASLVLANDPGDIFRSVAGAGWGLLAVVALRLPQILFSAVGWAPLIAHPARPGWAALFLMRWVRDAVNALLPVAQLGGEFVRAQLLIRQGVDTARASASVAVDLAVEMAAQVAFAAVGLAVLMLVPHEGGAVGWLVAATALCAAMAAGFVAAQRRGLFRLLDRVLPRLTRRPASPASGGSPGMHDAVVRLHREPGRLWSSGAAHLASWLFGALETWAALHVLGIEAGLAEALVIESLSQAVRSVGFAVPGAIGVQEGGFVLVCGLFGIPADQAIALALVRRIRDVALGLPGVAAWRWEATAAGRGGARSAAAPERTSP